MSGARDTEYRVGLLRREPELDALCGPWTELIQHAAHPTPFLSWEWTTSWWRHRDRQADLWVLTAHSTDGRLAGLLPLMLVHERRGPLPVRRLAFIGSGLATPVHLDVVAREDEMRPVAAAFVDYLTAHRSGWDVLELDNLRSESPLKPLLQASGKPFREWQAAPARYAELTPTWQEYEQQRLSGTRRRHIGQYRRKLEREHQDVEFYEVKDGADLSRRLDALVDQNRTRWHENGVPSSFDDSHFVEFHRDLAPRALGSGWLRFYVLRVGDEVAAAVYGLLYGDVFYCYQTAFNQEWGRYGPGNLIFGYMFEHAIAEGATEMNMGRGDQEYKLSWTDQMRYDSHLVVSGSMKGRLWSAGGSLYDTARRLSRRVLSQKTQDRINRYLSNRGHRNEHNNE